MGRPLTALLVINRLRHGGAEHSLAELLPHLERGGVRPIVACLAQAVGDLEPDVIAAGHDVRIVRGRSFANHARDLNGLRTAVTDLRAIIREEDPDLVHTTLFASDVAGRLASARTRAATLTSLVGNTYVPERLADPNVTAMKLGTSRFVDRWTGRAVNDRFHAISETTRASARAALGIPDDRITVIYRGRDGARLGRADPARRDAARALLGIERDAEVIVNVAQQEHRKGLVTMLDAMPTLVEQRPRVVFVHAGREGNSRVDIGERLARLDLGARVRMLGERNDVPEILAAADVFVFPSLNEGLGGSVIEAMALGLPIVASDIPAMHELLEPDRNALLVPPSAPGELAAAVSALLDDASRRRAFGEHSRQIFEQRFTLERSAALMLDLYQAVVEQHAARHGNHRAS